jgi:orotate phosphoribosyltransferase
MGELAKMLIDLGAVRFGDFTLASGRKSKYYVDIKKASTNTRFLKVLAKEMAAHTGGADRLAGIELGAIPILVALAVESGKPFVMVRKERKDHGTSKMLEGDLYAGENVCFVEDVTTTAGTLMKGIDVVRQAGGNVTRVLVIVDREEGARENLAAMGVELVPMVRVSELLDKSSLPV